MKLAKKPIPHWRDLPYFGVRMCEDIQHWECLNCHLWFHHELFESSPKDPTLVTTRCVFCADVLPLLGALMHPVKFPDECS